MRNFALSSRPLSTVISRNVSKDQSWQTEDDERVVKSTPHLIANMPETLVEKLLSVTARKFQMESTQRCLRYLEKNDFPLPNSLTEDQWVQLLDFETSKAKTLYIEAIEESKDQDENLIEELQEMDKIHKLPLTPDPDMLAEVVGDDPELQKRWAQACFLHEQLQIRGKFVWPYLTKEQMKQVVEPRSNTKIMEYFLFFASKQFRALEKYVKKKGRVIRGEKERKEHEERLQNNDHISYGLGRNTLMMRIESTKWDNWGNYKHCREIMSEWHQPLVIDLQWIKDMPISRTKSLIFSELIYSMSYNRLSQQPYALHFTNVDFSKAGKNLRNAFPKMNEGMETFTEKSMLESFPKEKLVYLSPDSRNRLKYDDDDVYIIGGFVDTPLQPGATLAFAKEHKLRHARLPMKETIGFNASMNVETVVSVLLDYRRTRDWLYAMRWVQPRFFKNQMRNQVYTGRQEYIYFAHSQLHPNHMFDNNAMLRPAQYRKQFGDIVKKCPNPNALLSGKYEKKISNKDRLGLDFELEY